MAQNLLRVYKSLLIEILEDYLEHLKSQNQVDKSNSSFISYTKREGPSAVIDAISYVKKLGSLKPFYWNKLLS